jgi:hypothetical protein
LATQRITVAKIGGVAADIVIRRLREWSAARQTADWNSWSADQWPKHVREQAGEFANQLRAHALAPPVIHFIEWADMWSMGDLFSRWLTLPESPSPFVVYSHQFEIYGYGLPDEGRLDKYLGTAGPQQFWESDWYIRRLREAIEAWHALAERAVLVVLRQAIDVSVSDEAVSLSLTKIPDWLSEEGPCPER